MTPSDTRVRGWTAHSCRCFAAIMRKKCDEAIAAAPERAAEAEALYAKYVRTLPNGVFVLADEDS